MHILVTTLMITISIYLVKFIYTTIWLPWKIGKHLRSQGIEGPPYSLIYGNTEEIKRLINEASKSNPIHFSHDVLNRVTPHYYKWSPMYGKTLVFWFGSKPRVILAEPEMIKEVMVNNGSVIKEAFNPVSKMLVGQGLLGLDGEKWATHRKLASRAFTMERVKAWVPEIVASTSKEMIKWVAESGGRDEFEIDMHKALHKLSADILSRTAFGSNFEEGKRIFELQDKQAMLTLQAKRSVYIPGFRFLPTRENRVLLKIEKEIRDSVRILIEKNSKNRENSKSLLTLLRHGNGEEKGLDVEEVIDECKTFYFAGKETTGNVLSWVFLLLAMNPEWQTRARDEVYSVCKGNELPSSENIHELKIVTMILHETLRLYPPAEMLVRQASKNVKVGKLDVPANTGFNLPIFVVHHDTEIWGDDANEFKPERFSEPMKHSGSYFPFGLGPKICVGQNLAMVEMKIIVSMIIQQFHLTISPSYVHSPVVSWSLQPQYGAQIILTRVTST